MVNKRPWKWAFSEGGMWRSVWSPEHLGRVCSQLLTGGVSALLRSRGSRDFGELAWLTCAWLAPRPCLRSSWTASVRIPKHTGLVPASGLYLSCFLS